MNSPQMKIAENYQRILQSIDSACARVGRSAAAVKLVAVTKYADLEWVRCLPDLGIWDLGESRPQQLVERAPLLPESVRWHMIGHLQRNKARRVLPLVSFIHSIDSVRLLAAIDRMAEEAQLIPRVLLEINLSGESTKDGFSTDDLLANWERVLEFRHVQVDGLMTMAVQTDQPEKVRPTFQALRQLRDRLIVLSPPSVTLPELSMGMSADFEIAIEEGATIIRVGSRLFTGLEHRD